MSSKPRIEPRIANNRGDLFNIEALNLWGLNGWMHVVVVECWRLPAVPAGSAGRGGCQVFSAC